MGPSNCAVIGCHNSYVRLKKWEAESCIEHGKTKKNCPCEPPYRLFMFPSGKRNVEKRNEWIKLMKRVTSKNTPWVPCASDRVCSDHFVDYMPSHAHPNPSLKLGYDQKKQSKRRELVRKPLFRPTTQSSHSSVLLSPPHSPPPVALQLPLSQTTSSSSSKQHAPLDHNYCVPDDKDSCHDCVVKKALIGAYQKKINTLTKQMHRLKMTVRKDKISQQQQKPFSINNIKTDEKMNFYTGITSICMFHALFKILEPVIPSMFHWGDRKRVLSQHARVKKFDRRSERARKLSPKNALLLTLMRLRLGLLNEDLADRFCISTGLCSQTFKTYVSLLAETLGKHLVKWLPFESVRENMPKIYRKSGYGKVRVIIDCSEVFIERSKSLDTQALTWSDYKSHNTVKFLIGITPTGFISFLSKCYGGRASDKFICSDSGFLDCLDPYDEVMADRGFQIQEELMLRFCTLSVPPGARLKSQMTTSEVKKTKEVANLRIHVERAINRIKTFRILKYTLPITMLHHCDDIVRTCAALCNLKPLLFKDSDKTDD